MEIYVSTDIETDGPIPGPNSMLSFGSAAFTAEGRANFSATCSQNAVGNHSRGSTGSLSSARTPNTHS